MDHAMTKRQLQAAVEEQTTTGTPDLRREVAEGFLYAHSRLNANTSKTLEGASFLYALIELLSEKGVVTVDELDERKRVVGQRLAEELRRNGNGVMLQDPEYEKYSFRQSAEIDCESRVHLCKAACCRLPFALSKQDIREGVVRWSLGEPYLIDQGKDGYCVHLDRCASGCTIYEHRPVPCRGFDCRHDGRVWLDFENRIVNPAVEGADWPHCVTEEHPPQPSALGNPRHAGEAQAHTGRKTDALIQIGRPRPLTPALAPEKGERGVHSEGVLET